MKVARMNLTTTQADTQKSFFSHLKRVYSGGTDFFSECLILFPSSLASSCSMNFGQGRKRNTSLAKSKTEKTNKQVPQAKGYSNN
jgi:hypothetical protein